MPTLSTPLAPNYPLTGITTAQRPALTAHVIYDILHPFTRSGINWQLQSRVERSFSTGHIDLYYRLINLSSVAAHIKLVEIYYLFKTKGLILTFADFRVDGVGTVAPTNFRPSVPADGDTKPENQPVVFDFNQDVPAGGSTRFFFISTNATSFEPLVLTPEASLTFIFDNGIPNEAVGIFVVPPAV